MQNLSQELLHKLENNYEQIALMYDDGVSLEDIRTHLNITDSDMQQMEEVIFNMFPYYRVKDMDGNEKVMRFNAHTLQSKEVIYEY